MALSDAFCGDAEASLRDFLLACVFLAGGLVGGILDRCYLKCSSCCNCNNGGGEGGGQAEGGCGISFSDWIGYLLKGIWYVIKTVSLWTWGTLLQGAIAWVWGFF